MRLLSRFLKRQRGLTLTELVVVAAILSVLAALTAVAVTGTTSTAKSTTKTVDETEVTKAAGAFSGTHSKGFFPVTLDVNGSQKTFTVSEDVALLFELGDGSTTVDVYEIDRDADDGTGKAFSPGYIKQPKHFTETVDHDDNPVTPEIGVWVIIKSTGDARVLVADTSY